MPVPKIGSFSTEAHDAVADGDSQVPRETSRRFDVLPELADRDARQ
jgi:hypothetical protein